MNRSAAARCRGAPWALLQLVVTTSLAACAGLTGSDQIIKVTEAPWARGAASAAVFVVDHVQTPWATATRYSQVMDGVVCSLSFDSTLSVAARDNQGHLYGGILSVDMIVRRLSDDGPRVIVLQPDMPSDGETPSVGLTTSGLLLDYGLPWNLVRGFDAEFGSLVTGVLRKSGDEVRVKGWLYFDRSWTHGRGTLAETIYSRSENSLVGDMVLLRHGLAARAELSQLLVEGQITLEERATESAGESLEDTKLSALRKGRVRMCRSYLEF